MFHFDEKRFFEPCDHTGHFPHEKPRYTMTEEVENTSVLMKETIARLLRFEERLKKDFDSLMQRVGADNNIFKTTLREAYTVFITEVKNEINAFEGNVDSTVALFQKDTESNYATLSEDVHKQIHDNVEDFKAKVTAFETAYIEAFETFKELLNTRLDNHASTMTQNFVDFQITQTGRMSEIEREITDILNESVVYMKTNLNGSLEALLYELKENGGLMGVIQTEVFVTPEMFGAVGDGVANDTEAFINAIARNKPLYLTKTYSVNGVELPAFVTGKGAITGSVSFNEENTAIEGVSFNGCEITINTHNATFTKCHFDNSSVKLMKWANCFTNCGFWRTNIYVEAVNGATNNFIGCYLGGAERLFYGTPANLHISGGWIEENTNVFEIGNTGNTYGITVDNCDLETNNNLVHAIGGATSTPIIFNDCVILGNSVTTNVISTEGSTSATNNVSVKFKDCFIEKVKDFTALKSINVGIEGLPQHCYTRNIPYENDVNVSWNVREPLTSVDVPEFEVVEKGNNTYHISLPKPCFIGDVTCDNATSIIGNRCVNGEFVTTTRTGNTGVFNSTCYGFDIVASSKPTVRLTTPSNIYGGM